MECLCDEDYALATCPIEAHQQAARTDNDNIPARLICTKEDWQTPDWILGIVRDIFDGSIPLDPATDPGNRTKATRFYTKAMDGLSLPWQDQTFVNPPYGRYFPSWCHKIHEEAKRGFRIAALLPCGARFSTRYFQDHVLNDYLTCQLVFRGRVAFGMSADDMETKAGNIYDSILWCYGIRPTRLVRAGKEFGRVISMEVR